MFLGAGEKFPHASIKKIIGCEYANNSQDPKEQLKDGYGAVGVVFNINRYAVHDGPGIRVTTFLKGCPLRCQWCHNPEGMRLDPRPIVQAYEVAGTCLRDDGWESGTGRVMSVRQVLTAIEKDMVFIEESGGGATFSGGEPLMQPEFLCALLDACRAHGIHTAVDTSGFANSPVFQVVARHADLFLYDLKLMDDAEHRKFIGTPNHPILNNLRWLAAAGAAPFIIRVPIIPGITDSEANLTAMGEFLCALRRPIRMNLLPYHGTGAHKYKKLALQNHTENIVPPSAERMQSIRQKFLRLGFQVSIGG